MPNQNTYYSKEELAAIEAAADEQDESFSGIVRRAVRRELDIGEVEA